MFCIYVFVDFVNERLKVYFVNIVFLKIEENIIYLGIVWVVVNIWGISCFENICWILVRIFGIVKFDG